MKIAFIGFGVVGQGLARLLRDQTDFSAQIVAVSTRTKGALYHPDGLNIDELFNALDEAGNFSAYPDSPGLERDLDSEKIAGQTNADVIVEVSYTNMETGEPALSYCRAALESGKHLVTANKGPLALAYAELSELARKNGLSIGFEATVMAGTPAISLVQRSLAGCEIQAVRGILNGTTNYILTEMENGMGYADALKQAQELGYAEADPTADVDGWDTLSKVLILANAVMGANLTVDDIQRKGIAAITAEDVTKARESGQRWKLIGSIKRENGKVVASVEPLSLPLSDPLANVSGVTNAISYTTDLLGDVTLVGPGAGGTATAFGLLSDLMAIG